VNPVRNSSGALNPVGNILKSNPAKGGTEEQHGIISNGVKEKERKGSARKDPDLLIFIDGASRGNPGRAGAGVYITNMEGKRIVGTGRYLGHKTNNEAEYGALLLGLQEAKRLGGEVVRIFTDSELIERQVKGIYRVKELHLRILHRRVMEKIKEFASFEIESIPRKENQEADLFANQAIERRMIKEREKGGIGRESDGRSSSPPAKGGDRGEESPSSAGQGGP
jgi:ribonuclease HI